MTEKYRCYIYTSDGRIISGEPRAILLDGDEEKISGMGEKETMLLLSQNPGQMIRIRSEDGSTTSYVPMSGITRITWDVED